MNNNTNDLIPPQNSENVSDVTSSLLNSTLNSIREGILVVDLKGKI